MIYVNLSLSFHAAFFTPWTEVLSFQLYLSWWQNMFKNFPDYLPVEQSNLFYWEVIAEQQWMLHPDWRNEEGDLRRRK